MNRILIIAIVLVFSVPAYAQPEIKFNAETHDMGIVSQEAVSYSFEFENAGTSELIVGQLIPS